MNLKHHLMPTTSKTRVDHLAPIAPQYKCTAPTALVLKETKLPVKGKAVKIEDSIGNILFKVDAKDATLSHRYTLIDVNGNGVAQLRKTMSGVPGVFYIGTMENKKVCTLKAKGPHDKNMGKCASIHVLGEKVGFVRGNWRSKDFGITIDGREVASIARKSSFTDVALDAGSYCISVNKAGVDVLFILLISIALDELDHD